MNKLNDYVKFYDNQRIPLSNNQRKDLKKIFPYYGAQGIIDYVDNYIFDGEYLLVAEDGNNLKSMKEDIAIIVNGKFWVNNHAHILKALGRNNLKYIGYWINSIDIRGFITGSAQPKLSQKSLASIPCQLPSPSQQDKVVCIIDNIDQLISLKKKEIECLEKTSQLTYDYWFLDFNFPDKNGEPYKASGGKMVWNEELKQEIPKGWNCVTLDSFLTETRGISYNTKTISDPNGVPMINLASFTPGTGAYKSSGLKYYSGDIPNDKLLNPYDLVICNTQQTDINPSKDIIGYAILLPDIFKGDKVTFSHHVTKINCEDIYKPFLFKLFNSEYYHKYISGFASGTSILGLNFDGVKYFKLAFPPRKVLEDYNSIFMSIQKQQSSLMMEIENLKSLRDFLLPLLMNGQVTFKDSED